MVQYLLCHFYTPTPDIMMCYVQLSALQKQRIRILPTALLPHAKLPLLLLMPPYLNFLTSADLGKMVKKSTSEVGVLMMWISLFLITE
jgi:hypothetical protein